MSDSEEEHKCVSEDETDEEDEEEDVYVVDAEEEVAEIAGETALSCPVLHHDVQVQHDDDTVDSALGASSTTKESKQESYKTTTATEMDIPAATCWVCFATVEDEPTAKWLRPCHCRGTSKWVHEACLQRWIDEKQKGNSTTKVRCPQCEAEYIIVFPSCSPLVKILEGVDSWLLSISPYCAGIGFCISVYWCSWTFGFLTVVQVMGLQEGTQTIDKADPLVAMIMLPTIPYMLILARMIPWDQYLLRVWRRHGNKLPFIKHAPAAYAREPAEGGDGADTVKSGLRLFLGAMALPTMATICGKLFFRSVRPNWQRAILGGIFYIAVKGVVKIYYKQGQYERQANRVILDFHPREEEGEVPLVQGVEDEV
ncbi:E3 ubiquitin-protein ligase MARCHF5-like [Branchiostoma floridae]|uniref:E3 ubiquitin-protein ligase MARCHF5 n=2 Tax=Branchiostoma floridae TaxID=7739 RepID=A0A9J7M230_BRAFL|nr:E3 ubiquitin-protein ligase MARCHF5-like [Branchiostoma floridae]